MQQSYSKLAYQPSYLICLLHLNAFCTLYTLYAVQTFSVYLVYFVVNFSSDV